MRLYIEWNEDGRTVGVDAEGEGQLYEDHRVYVAPSEIVEALEALIEAAERGPAASDGLAHRYTVEL